VGECFMGRMAPYVVPICTAIGGRIPGQEGSVTSRRMPLHCVAFQTYLRESKSWTQGSSNYVSSKLDLRLSRRYCVHYV
jgi:hypothetical protein